jgi:hypothetical protein
LPSRSSVVSSVRSSSAVISVIAVATEI